MNVLSVICARAGSRGLKNKCTYKINDKMLAVYAVEYSLSLGANVKTVVSTDIKELIEYCRARDIQYIDRNPEYCRSDSRIDDALADALEIYGDDCQLCSLVYGNIPTRYPEIFHQGLDFLGDGADYDAALSMQNVEKFHPAWMFDYDEDFLPREPFIHYRRQMLPPKMIHDGHTLIFKVDRFLARYTGAEQYDSSVKYANFGDRIKPILNNKVIIDIDTEKDLNIAEAIITWQER